MAIRDIFKVTRKTFINPAGWIDYNALKEYNRTIWDVLRNLFTSPQPVREESFEAAMERLKLSEKDVKSIINNYQIYCYIFLALGLLLFLYAFYILFHHGSFTGWLLGLSASALFFSQAFRYSFWSLQMEKRKLGLTFAEWKNHVLGEKGTSK